MGDTDIKWYENMLCSNKDRWKNPPFCNTEEEWWHIWSHTEFMKTKNFLQRVQTCYSVSFSSNKRSHFTTGELWKPERAAGEGNLSKKRALGSFSIFNPEISEGQFILHCFCLLRIKFDIPSPDMWHFTLVLSPQKRLAHLFWGNLASESDFSRKF